MALKCFIAMAFGNADTDELYDKTIEPLLGKMGITPFRVDRSNRNEDIDDQIISEIRKCDFVISDLTYSRPSVYYEAGFACGLKKQVVYTCREDHFKHQPIELRDRLKVHFDLQMKPIVKWGKPSDAKFKKRLQNRIEFVAKPLQKDKQALEAAEKARLEFDKLSANAKLDRLDPNCKTTLRKFDYTRHKIIKKGDDRVRRLGDNAGKKIFYKKHGFKLDIVIQRNYLTISAKQLRWANVIPDVNISDILESAKNRSRLPKQAEKHIFLCVLQKLTRSRVAAALDNYAIEETKFGFIAKSEPKLEGVTKIDYSLVRFGKMPKTPKQIPVVRWIHLICGIESESQFKAALKEHLQPGKIMFTQASPAARTT